jgi:hypothetical protein
MMQTSLQFNHTPSQKYCKHTPNDIVLTLTLSFMNICERIQHRYQSALVQPCPHNYTDNTTSKQTNNAPRERSTPRTKKKKKKTVSKTKPTLTHDKSIETPPRDCIAGPSWYFMDELNIPIETRVVTPVSFDVFCRIPLVIDTNNHYDNHIWLCCLLSFFSLCPQSELPGRYRLSKEQPIGTDVHILDDKIIMWRRSKTETESRRQPVFLKALPNSTLCAHRAFKNWWLGGASPKEMKAGMVLSLPATGDVLARGAYQEYLCTVLRRVGICDANPLEAIRQGGAMNAVFAGISPNLVARMAGWIKSPIPTTQEALLFMEQFMDYVKFYEFYNVNKG